MIARQTLAALLLCAAITPVFAQDAPAKPAEAAKPATPAPASKPAEKPAEPAKAESTTQAEAKPPTTQAKPTASADAAKKPAADANAAPQKFIPSEQVRADFDVSFPVDI